MGDRLWWHPSLLFRLDNYRGDAVNVFGNVISMSMLGVRRDAPVGTTGLVPVRGPDDWGFDRFGVTSAMEVYAR
jgi:hypothetical protein